VSFGNDSYIDTLLDKVHTLQRVALEAQALSWVFECRCHEAYTSRGLHEPNALCGENVLLLEALADLENTPT